MTHRSDHEQPDKDGLQDSTIHEETIDGWKAKTQGHGHQCFFIAESPDFTDGNDAKSQLGDGPIYIKKSTELCSYNRRQKLVESETSLEVS